MELLLSVLIDRDVFVVAPDTVSYETGATPAQVRDVSSNAYEHHGVGFGPDAPGALQRFYEDLLLGRPFPLKFSTRSIADFDTIFAIALFLHRNLAVAPNAPATIAVVDAAHRIGLPYLAHLDRDFSQFLRRLRAYFPTGLSKRETGERLTVAVGWVHDYMTQGVLPRVGSPEVALRVLDHGTNGFLLGQADGNLVDAWMEAFRSGFLRGVILGADQDGRRQVLGARKSPYLQLDLTRAATTLNEMERAMGEVPGWVADPLWLRCPVEGTALLPTHITEVLLRV
jgi:hypothetical protein